MELTAKNVVVVGLARTGVSAARFAAKRGARVTATDIQGPEKLAAVKGELENLGVRVVLGGHPEGIFDNADAVVVSPGVPLSSAPLHSARQKGLRVVGDVEFAAPYLAAPSIAITGTNGKSTVTTLVGKMLAEDGRNVFVGANIGRPVFEAIDGNFDALVLELSSYQIETLESLHPKVAVLLNVTEDHLDRYDSFEHYRTTKAHLLALVPADGTVIVNLDDPACLKSAEGVRAQCIGFTLEDKPAPAGWGRIWLEGETAVTSDGTKVSLSASRLTGRHNQANQLAAIAAALSFGVKKDSIARVIASFEGLPHRCQFVAEIRGVRYYDDSKGTNVGAVCESLRGFAGPVILVAGGIGKGGSYAPMAEACRGRVRVALLIGQAREEIAASLKGICQTESFATLQDAVKRAAEIGKPGDTVLLSPACASFDMFRDYADRGDQFQEAVRRMAS